MTRVDMPQASRVTKEKDIKSELIGFLIQKPSLIPDVNPIMGFSDPLSGPLSEHLRVIVDMYDKKELISAPIVVRKVSKKLEQPPKMHEDIIYGCVEQAKNFNKLGGYVEEILNSLKAEKIRSVVNSISSTSGNYHADADEMLERLEGGLADLRSSIVNEETDDNAADEILKEVQAYKSSGEIPMIKTGLWELDKMIGGLGKGEYITISGLEGTGKSVLASTMMLHMSQPLKDDSGKSIKKSGRKTAFVSLEMAKVDVIKRTYIQVNKFNMRDAYAKKMSGVEMEAKVVESQLKLDAFNIDIVSPRSNNSRAIKNLCRTLHSNGAECIFIDYFQLITSGIKEKTRDLEEVSDEFRRLAIELNIPIVMLSQQNDDARIKTDKNGNEYGGVSRGNIKNCKNIARDVHICILIHEKMNALIVDKNRNGEGGKIPVSFNKHGRLLYTGNRADTGAKPI